MYKEAGAYCQAKIIKGRNLKFDFKICDKNNIGTPANFLIKTYFYCRIVSR